MERGREQTARGKAQLTPAHCTVVFCGMPSAFNIFFLNCDFVVVVLSVHFPFSLPVLVRAKMNRT